MLQHTGIQKEIPPLESVVVFRPQSQRANLREVNSIGCVNFMGENNNEIIKLNKQLLNYSFWWGRS